MYLLDRGILKQGDIILTCSNEKPSKMIQKLTGTEYSHAILYVGGSSYIHSDLAGVHSGNTQRLVIDNPGFVKVVRVNNQSAINKAIEYARLQVGTSYSKLSAANAGAKIFSKLDTTRQFCSRLVAKSYEYAGVELVSNAEACLPQEIADSNFVNVIENCVYLARKEEIEFALSFDPIKKQSEITNSVLKSTRKLIGNKIQALSDITSHLIEDPKFDKEITEIYQLSGYLDMWRYEKEKNPWRYDVKLFRALPLTKYELGQYAHKEIEIAEGLLALYKNNLEQYFYIKEQYKLKYAEQQFNLYEQLVENALDHKFTAEAVINET
ncbi:YiiX/YebB-like N1pC/P60 family cysteine hydrolase [Candidatus Nitrotoga sp. M5]|uniref:YiiX/YebB-like N1pC/P60 family cysteine hydrolase n=1 Tax=Candidatus Nitrotoga sp. M5 TaxID=2890409 RepID=UPI001EF4A3D6|nr:YiiX/YebB-like N1pC/P60 family cysteine hydrolase [Candidatus Nitrotoga sp. M5]CAH1388093.1 conserved hypothetical protein [Candidatus Nitrotoga sp. M5]